MERTFMKICQKVILLCLVFAAGCQRGDRPRMRLGTYPTSTLGSTFLEPGRLGPHGYRFDGRENDGLVYTCRGGHIDVAHVRIAADWTKYLSERSYACLMKEKSDFSFRLLVEPSKCSVKIEYPPYWDKLTERQKEKIVRKVSIELGQYLAFSITTWHEILTWFGYKCILMLPEYPSAFSWDDSYSNLLGARIAGDVLRNNEMEYEEAMAEAIDRELEYLGAQPAKVGEAASESVRGNWFDGPSLFLVDMRMRNLDIGLDDGFITPTLVPEISQCVVVEPQSYPVPNLGFLETMRFKVKVEIKPREWERGKIFRIVNKKSGIRKKRIDPKADFSTLMAYIHQDAVKKGYKVFPTGADALKILTSADQ